MGCCDETTARVPDTDVSRRSLFKGAALIASIIPAVRSSRSLAQGRQVKLAYCSQLLCGVPYEVARSSGIFKNHGLDVQLVYTRGGTAAMQALIGGAVDYAATSLDVAIQAYANVGADIRRFAVTGASPCSPSSPLPGLPARFNQSRISKEGRSALLRSALPIMR
jgi:NitT/TauT family transport system substrate-binding protein